MNYAVSVSWLEDAQRYPSLRPERWGGSTLYFGPSLERAWGEFRHARKFRKGRSWRATLTIYREGQQPKTLAEDY